MKKMNPQQKRTPAMLVKLVTELAQTANISESARRCGISRWLAVSWYAKSLEGTLLAPNTVALDDNEDPLPLHVAWDAALEVATDYLEKVAFNLATGYKEPIFYQGRRSYELDPDTMEMVPVAMTKYSERLIEVLLKARRPDVYRERHEVAHKGAGGVLLIPSNPVDPEEWAKAVEKYQAKGRGEPPKKK